MIKRMRVFFLILSFLTIAISHSQENLESNLIGEWEFKLDIKDVIKNSDELTGFEKLAARTFSGVIEKALDKTKILFDFKKDNTAAITVITSEKTQSRVIFSWEINENGYLVLEEISEQSEVRLGDTAYWKFDNDKLIPYDSKSNINEGILLIKVK